MTEYVKNFYKKELEYSKSDLEYWNDMLKRLREDELQDHAIYDFTVIKRNEAAERIQFYGDKLEN
ncbi:hypothetical protein [Pontibacillus litoralis]|uniref:Uncharacterized protein n=1 Tax=Pontibacillus litoralis JSM 072002 TaxID=1385512 RepID=A0A0A5HKH2_9BACI|nr:hypothetical protein [Pontibacillus litoralis]KGX84132.1 hypothetical protein N784_14575 [Pontibacillus litoralis JSM 072002]